jgi:hypothetical protein
MLWAFRKKERTLRWLSHYDDVNNNEHHPATDMHLQSLMISSSTHHDVCFESIFPPVKNDNCNKKVCSTNTLAHTKNNNGRVDTVVKCIVLLLLGSIRMKVADMESTVEYLDKLS